MSIKLMSKAWEMDIPSGQKIVLLALCDHANDDGSCYPSQDKLSAKCSLSLRAIIAHIKWLSDRGILTSERRQNRGNRLSNVYQISLENFTKESKSQHAESAHANFAHAESALSNVQKTTSQHAESAHSFNEEPSVNHQLEPSVYCADAFAPVAAAKNLPAKNPTASKKEPNPANVKTWEAYRNAYLAVYQCEPIRNAKVNSQIANFVKAVGEDAAPLIAQFYVSHPNQWYRTKGHDIGTLLANVQSIHTDYQRRICTTSTQARQAEKTAANIASHDGALAILKKQGVI